MVWPIREAEYGNYHWLRKEVTAVMPDYPKDASLLDYQQRSVIDSIIEGGLFRFYFPPPSEMTIPDATEAQKERLRRAPHSWSFLQLTVEIAMESGKSEYELPIDFGNFLGEPTTSRSNSNRLAIAQETHLRQLISSEGKTDNPQYCAKKVVSGEGASRSRNSLLVYPIPNGAETITVQYAVVPPRLSNEYPWPLGGTEHAQAILACCLAVMEERSGGGSQVYRQKMIETLASSVLLDIQSAAATTEGVWPDDDDPSLLTSRGQILKRIGIHIGAGPNARVWTASQNAKIKEIFKEGMRLACNPPPIPGMKYPHQWGWLTPLATITTAADVFAYDLPADFAYIDGPMTLAPSDYMLYPPVEIIGEFQVRNLLQESQASSRPTKAAVRVKAPLDDNDPTRYELILWPLPDGVYQLQYRYRINPEVLS